MSNYRFERVANANVEGTYRVWRGEEMVGTVHRSWARSGGTGWAFSMTSATYPTRELAARAAYSAYQRQTA